MESLFIKFGNHGNDDACAGLCFLGCHGFIKSDDGVSFSVGRAGADGYCSSKCTRLSGGGGVRRDCYHGNVVCVPKVRRTSQRRRMCG